MARTKVAKEGSQSGSRSSSWSYLVIVESPTKAKTIRRFLPPGYHVEACVGHIRDLPASAKEIPEKFRKEKWASLGIDVDHGFTPLYVIPSAKTKVIRNLKDLLSQADELILATDEDREGESISHHLIEVLKPKVPVKRMVFHEITKEAIQDALKNFRDIDDRLVQAQESRRILDRLVGYSLSPVLWKKIAYGLSAGRVQSVAVRLIVEREEERLRFKQATYCGLLAELLAQKQKIEAKLTRVGGKKVATGKDFDESTGKLIAGSESFLLDQPSAESLKQRLLQAAWSVTDVTEKPLSRKPAPPFITSTLQQEANRKLGLSARDAMRTAQSLYEQGFITYMRTDSVHLSQEALSAARAQVQSRYGQEYLSDGPRQYTSKSKMAQEAHEAIRPSGTQWQSPQETGLSGRELQVYELIWMRTVASQMADSKQLSVTITFQADDSEFQVSGTRILFPGFLRAYVEGSDDPEAALEEKEVLLPGVKVGEMVKLESLSVTEHETKPPARYTEASLVQMLEKEDIGRPSTYASILSTIVDRGYVKKVGHALVPTFTAFAVIQLLKKHFPDFVDLRFTALMEDSLDDIAEGKRKALDYLKQFYFDQKSGLKIQIETKEKKIDPEEARQIHLDLVPGVQFRVGRFGPYLSMKVKGSDEPVRASIPEDMAPSDLGVEQIEQIIQQKKDGPPSLGLAPDTGEKIYVMTGRYGPYLQKGETPLAEEEAGAKKKKKKKGEVSTAPKVKRAMIPKGIDPTKIQLEEALGYLSLPRKLGLDTEGHQVSAGMGRFGPYIVKSGAGLEKPEYRSLKKEDHVLSVDLKRALEIFAEPKVGRGRGKKAGPLRVIGNHPADNQPIEVYIGPYGPYVKSGKTNASIPREIKPEDLTLEKAADLINARR